MLTTYKLSDGSRVTGDENDIAFVDSGNGPFSYDDWNTVFESLAAGKIVINIAHVVQMRQPNDVELTHYKAFGAT